MAKGPSVVDIHVGRRLRDRRNALGVTQEFLADKVDLTFQQIQKYEKGVNRISASRLQQFANILKVDVAWFFDAAPGSNRPSKKSESLEWLSEFVDSPEGRRLMRAFVRIVDPELRRHIARLVERVADLG